MSTIKTDKLAWDTDFFGFPIAIIRTPKVEVSALKETLTSLKEDGIKFVYWPSLQGDESFQKEVEKLGGRLVDRKLTYIAPLDDPDIPTYEGPTVSYTSSEPTPELLSLAVQSGGNSRFFVDPDIPNERFEELYRSWLRNSLNKTLAEEILVIYEGDLIVGLITLAVKNGRGDIGLVAVDESARRKGYGKALVNAAKRWSLEKGCAEGQVVTQQANTGACRLYEACGYSVDTLEYYYHFSL